jgi:hypothetical protein
LNSRFRKLEVFVDMPEKKQRRQQGVGFTTRSVCATCNNEWMSKLESRAKPVLEPIVDGRQTSLDSVAQEIVAAWAVKTAMVAERAIGVGTHQLYWSTTERENFRQPPHVPPGDPGDATNVRIACYVGSKLGMIFAGASSARRLSEPSVHVAPLTRATLVIGKMVLQVESHRWKEVTGHTGRLTGPAHASRAQFIFPVRQLKVSWPPAPPLTDSEVDAFAAVPEIPPT